MNVFQSLKIPDFVDIVLSPRKTISTKILYTPARDLFYLALKNMQNDHKERKSFRNNSTYSNFLREYCKTKKGQKVLKYATEEWRQLTEENKEMYKVVPKPEENKPCLMKTTKRVKHIRSVFSIYVMVKSLKKQETYDTIAGKWSKLTSEKKVAYKELKVYDTERFDFESITLSRFELVLRLLASSAEKLLKKFSSFDIYKMEMKASLLERGLTNMPRFELLSRKKYSRVSEEQKGKHKRLAKIKNQENIDLAFDKVLRKANVFFGDWLGTVNENANSMQFEEDFDEFIVHDMISYTI